MSESTAATFVTNVRVFDGERITGPTTVVFEHGRIVANAPDGRVIDARGAVLLPGLIDAHVHLHGRDSLRQLCRFGVTTAFDMGSWPASFVDEMRASTDLATVRSSGPPAVAPGGTHAHIPGFPPDAIVCGAGDAKRFVADRVAERCDYIKVVVERPGAGALEPPTLEALVGAAHEAGLRVIAHASAYDAVVMAHRARVDVLTHVPLDRSIDDGLAAELAAAGHIAVPTLTMMRGVAANLGHRGLDYSRARESVAALHRAGVPILAGTDANQAPGVPAQVSHGSSLHEELELLVDAGLSALEALRAATALPARYFELPDRGAIAPGMRADLVLVEGDPLTEIQATRRIRRIWVAGVEHEPGS